MKRSEMINTIVDFLNTDRPAHHLYYPIWANHLLTMLEEQGMLPPYSTQAAEESVQIDAAGYEWEQE